MLTLRFDMRAPPIGAPTTELYRAAIDMCAWAESRGAIAAVLSEHHGTEDNHLPTPLILASAIAARTERLAIMLASVVLPFCDVIRLAEEMSVLDIISRGRVTYVFGIGHRTEEYEHFGIDHRARGKLADAKLALLLELLAGKPVVHRARSVEELRAGRADRIFALDEAIAYVRSGQILRLLPLCSGLPPRLAWPYLERAADVVARARGQA